MALSQSAVLRLYNAVIEDTISSSRDAFLDEGVDEQVLIELKQLWENKITSSKAVQVEPVYDQMEGAASTSTTKKSAKANQNNASTSQPKQQPPQKIQQPISNGNSQPQPQPGTIPSVPQQQQQQAPPPQQQTQPQRPPMFSNILDPNKIVPIQITLPPQAGVSESRVLTIQVPAAALIGNQLQQVLTGPVISATMGLPQLQASNLLQQHVNAALQGQNSPLLSKPIPQVDGNMGDVKFYVAVPDIFDLHRMVTAARKQQLDGAGFETGLLEDSSDDDDDGSDEPSEDDDIDDEREEEDPDVDDVGAEAEPLNSEDDVSEEDPGDLFDTENVVVCQYDKINRSRNRWKFYLKDGIMNLNGKDYVFQKNNGDAEW